MGVGGARTEPRDDVASVDHPKRPGRSQSDRLRDRVRNQLQLHTGEPHECYWFNWIEPDGRLLVDRYQDDTTTLAQYIRKPTTARRPSRTNQRSLPTHIH